VSLYLANPLAGGYPLRMLRSMKAMVFAAGLGSRLKELTKDTPKCLMQAGGKTLLEHVLRSLMSVGVTEVVINTHYRAEKIEAYLAEHNNFNLQIHLSHETTLLDTGGGLKKAAHFFKGDKAFIVHNSDIFCTSDLTSLVQQHRDSDAIATLAVMRRASNRGLFFDPSMRLCGWTGEDNAPPEGSTLFAFAGISICSAELLDFMDSRDRFSIIEPFLCAARKAGRVQGSIIDAQQWIDIGTPENLATLQRKLS
jgi:NDP-sugar pyrophosphorylase family protein